VALLDIVYYTCIMIPISDNDRDCR
jgi:hypothetical protein